MLTLLLQLYPTPPIPHPHHSLTLTLHQGGHMKISMALPGLLPLTSTLAPNFSNNILVPKLISIIFSLRPEKVLLALKLKKLVCLTNMYSVSLFWLKFIKKLSACYDTHANNIHFPPNATYIFHI